MYIHVQTCIIFSHARCYIYMYMYNIILCTLCRTCYILCGVGGWEGRDTGFVVVVGDAGQDGDEDI